MGGSVSRAHMVPGVHGDRCPCKPSRGKDAVILSAKTKSLDTAPHRREGRCPQRGASHCCSPSFPYHYTWPGPQAAWGVPGTQ